MIPRRDQKKGIEIQSIAGLKRAVISTHRRLKLGVASSEVARWLPISVLFLTPGAILYRLGIASAQSLLASCVAILVLLLFLVLKSVRRGPSFLGAALRLDRTHQMSGRLAAALEFSENLEKSEAENGRGLLESTQNSKRRAYEGLVLESVKSLGAVSPRGAAPIEVPRGIPFGMGMFALWALLLVVPLAKEDVPQARVVATPSDSGSEWVSGDDAELLRLKVQELEEMVSTKEGKEAASRFNEIVLQVVAGEIERHEAFQMAAEFQADLEAAAADADALREGMQKRGETLEQRKITRELGKALKEHRYSDAEEALQKLAERLEAGTEALTPQELEQLRESLKEMRRQNEAEARSKPDEETQEGQRSSLERRRQELTEKKKKGTASKKELSELKRTERELKRLDRQKKRAKESAKKILSELDKQLAKAAQELQKEQKKAGQFLDKAREQVQQMKQRKLSDQEKKELLKQIQELKERLRRQNKDGKMKERLRQFQKRARGQQGEGKKGTGQRRQSGKGQKLGSGKIRLGPNGQPIPGQGQEGKGAQGEQQSAGKKPGHEHDPNLAGEQSRLSDTKTQDKTAVAQDTGQGESASETIVTAAEEGFSSASYERLFQEYRTVAEEVMDRETVPPGRKAHVRRYFELIRPRGESPVPQKEKE